MVFLIGPAVVEPSLNQVRLHGQTHKVEPRVMRVLLCLIARAGQVVTRDALLGSVWTEGVPNDEGLTQAVCKLRKAFGDRASDATIIETIPKVGYRLIAPVAASPVLRNGHAQPTVNGQVPLTSNGQVKQAEAPLRGRSSKALPPATFGFGTRNAEWRWLAVCFALLVLFCGLWSSYVAYRPGPTEHRRLFIQKVAPGVDSNQPPSRPVRFKAMLKTGTDTTRIPFDVEDIPVLIERMQLGGASSN